MRIALLSLGVFLLAAVSPAQQPLSFVNFETAPVHPVALGPDARTLAVCNLPDGRIELFDVSSGVPAAIGDVPVGVDPVSVRWRSTNELWVANYISRTINVVDRARRLVVDTLATLDGPADIQFAGSPMRAFVSCAKENTVQVFDALTRQVITNLVIDGERPKAMAVSPDGAKLYVAIFESGNGSTILVGTGTNTQSVLRHPSGPYGGQQPVPNDGANLRPPMNTNLYGYELFLPDSLIVKKNAAGRWMDDNHGDWTEFVSGTNAAISGRIPGWDLPDRDLAIIDTATLGVTYATGLMNLCMDVAVNPASGRIAVIGTDGANERRFEPNLRGTFLRVTLALVEPVTLAKTILDLNPHLDYSTPSVPPGVRDLSIGDPRGIVWNSAGTRGYVTGMGSRNLVVIDAGGQRVGTLPIELSEGPSGLVLDEPRQRLYALNRFSANLSVLDTTTLTVVTNVSFFDPTPAAIRIGRKHLYDTRRNSGLGQVSCASCHPDARFDRLAWDLGDPRAGMSESPFSSFPFHPMKGPLVTQTLQDIIQDTEAEPFMLLHWRGDRPDIESFNVTFTDLLARDSRLTTNEMREFKDFLSTIHFGPSRFREFDNSMPTNLPLPGFFGVDSNGVPDRTPLPNGNALAGQSFFGAEVDFLHGRFPLTHTTCRTCHGRQSGGGIEGDFVLFERDGGRPFKAVQLRSIADKLGLDLQGTNSRTGFGFRFDGRADTLTTLLSDVFAMTNNHEIADLTAFLLAFPGSGIVGEANLIGPSDSQDSHASVGKQFTLHTPQDLALLRPILEPGSVARAIPELVVRGVRDGLNRSWSYTYVDSLGKPVFTDRNDERITLPELLALAAPDAPLTFTVVPPGSSRRLGVDRDEDGIFDRTEIEYGFDPTDPLSRPDNQSPRIDGLLEPYRFVHPGMPVQALFSAVDSDRPAQALTYSLESDAPAGASINPTSGLFTWTPTFEQGHEVRVRVTDNGVPPLIDVMSLYVYIEALRVVDFQWNQPGGTNLIVASTIHNRTVAGRSYRLQYKDRLDVPAWMNVGDAVASYGGPIYLHDASATNAPQRFYRVVLVE
jgi:DNA-binding beta-propeller fold protein YncE